MSLRKLIYLEYAIGFIMCILLYMYLDYSMLLFFLLLLVPDITMIGYFFNNRIGFYFYNIGHSFILPFMLFIVAFFSEFPNLLMLVIIWIAHIYLDRSLGFGLKYAHSFKETHLQKIN